MSVTKAGPHKQRKARTPGTDGPKFPHPDTPHNNRKSSASAQPQHGGNRTSHKGAAAGAVTQHHDWHQHVKDANKEAKHRYDATHRYPITGGM